MATHLSRALFVSVLVVSASAGCTAAGEDESSAGSAVVSGAAERFQPGAEEKGGFNLANASWLVRAANVVYQNRDDQAKLEPALKAAIKSLDGSNIAVEDYHFFDAAEDTQAAYIRTNRVAILAFRGTESSLDLRRDLEYRHDALPGAPSDVRVHRGFYKAFNGAWRGEGMKVAGSVGLRDYLKEQQRKSYAEGKAVPLYVTGHSLGAALGTLLVNEAMSEGIDVAALYTFGSPRVGNPSFADFVARRSDEKGVKIFRVINSGDPVTMAPPRFLDYKHVSRSDEDEDKNARTVFLSKAGGLFAGDTNGEHTVRRQLSAVWAAVKTGYAKHHPIAYYSCKLDKVDDPKATCVERVQYEANKDCLAMARALAGAAVRSQAADGVNACGGTSGELEKEYVEALHCTEVVRLRDPSSFPSCITKASNLSCTELQAAKSEDLGSACDAPFVYTEETRVE